MEDAHVRAPRDVLAHFGVADAAKGLTQAQVESQRAKYGANELPEDPPTPLWKLILEQFQDQLVIILLLAAIVSFGLAVLDLWEASDAAPLSSSDLVTAFVEPLVILLILIANATVGVVQEANAEKAIEALKEYSPDEAKAIRDGHVVKLPARELVPGDIIDLAAGDKIPADARVLSISSSSFRVDQAILTGESVSVFKDIQAIKDTQAVKQDMINMLFSGTTITIGKARAVVTATGEATAIGHIHKAISETESDKSPLKKKLDEFGDWLAKMITVVCVLVWVINIRHFNDPMHHGWVKGAVYYFKIAVALAVAAIPEGLAVIITTCLALGTKKMAKQNAIVRTLPSVETLGCTSVICSDKTGTLTTNQMVVQDLTLVADAQRGQLVDYAVEGNSFAPYGRVSVAGSNAPVADYSLPSTVPAARMLALVCSLCNESSIECTDVELKEFMAVGEPTEAALKVVAEKLGTPDARHNATLPGMDPIDRASAVADWYASQYDRLKVLEFSRDRKSMSVVVQDKFQGTGKSLLVKGAPESVLDRCTKVMTADGAVVPLSANLRDVILRAFEKMAISRTLRVLACAYAPVGNTGAWTAAKDPAEYAKVEQDLVFVGLTGMKDPPRPQVRASIAACHSAGIRVIVITGDNKNTAEAICREIGVFGPHVTDLAGLSYTGREWDAMPKADKAVAIQRANLFSRVEPAHKQELVDLLQSQGAVVAMTGDGVNDAPALKKADIGVAMGSGTDVAKLASDMVLADDDFSTIVSAVQEGRAIYNNTKQFIRYLISSNIGEVVAIFLTVLLGMPEALIPVQLLWVNLVTDGLPATALGFNPPDPDIMASPPRKASEPIVGRWLFVRYVIVGAYVGGATVFAYAWWYLFYGAGPQITFYQLTHYNKCASLFPELGCDLLFTGEFPKRATTMSLSVLVVIEMFNAMNSLSENASLVQLPLWRNIYLVLAIALSMTLHVMILYVPFFATLFNIVPLTQAEWVAVVAISAPIIAIDEVLKWVSRTFLAEHAAIPAEAAVAAPANMSATVKSTTTATAAKGNLRARKTTGNASSAAETDGDESSTAPVASRTRSRAAGGASPATPGTPGKRKGRKRD
ncbi:hypothetical protein GGF32_008407 [Allomyces javanicus]|nr:hypothetical protein GGF32_008407 [Allomyces javanicus]